MKKMLHQEWVEARQRHRQCFHEAGHARTDAERATLSPVERAREDDWQRKLAYLDGRADGLREALDIADRGGA